MRDHGNLILSLSQSDSKKRIHDANTIDNLPMVQVFAQHNAAARLLGGVKYQCIPIGNHVQPVHLDSSKYIVKYWLDQTKCAVNLDFVPCQTGV